MYVINCKVFTLLIAHIPTYNVCSTKNFIISSVIDDYTSVSLTKPIICNLPLDAKFFSHYPGFSFIFLQLPTS